MRGGLEGPGFGARDLTSLPGAPTAPGLVARAREEVGQQPEEVLPQRRADKEGEAGMAGGRGSGTGRQVLALAAAETGAGGALAEVLLAPGSGTQTETRCLLKGGCGTRGENAVPRAPRTVPGPSPREVWGAFLRSPFTSLGLMEVISLPPCTHAHAHTHQSEWKTGSIFRNQEKTGP